MAALDFRQPASLMLCVSHHQTAVPLHPSVSLPSARSRLILLTVPASSHTLAVCRVFFTLPITSPLRAPRRASYPTAGSARFHRSPGLRSLLTTRRTIVVSAPLTVTFNPTRATVTPSTSRWGGPRFIIHQSNHIPPPFGRTGRSPLLTPSSYICSQLRQRLNASFLACQAAYCPRVASGSALESRRSARIRIRHQPRAHRAAAHRGYRPSVRPLGPSLIRQRIRR